MRKGRLVESFHPADQHQISMSPRYALNLIVFLNHLMAEGKFADLYTCVNLLIAGNAI